MRNPFGIVERLNEAEKAELDALDETPPPHVLEQESREAATVRWVKDTFRTHIRWCPAQRALHRIAMVTLAVLAMVFVVNICGALWVTYSAKATFRQAVREVLKEEGIIHAAMPTRDGLAQGLAEVAQ